ncbi:helix-turn-helix domain-containing protein [Ruminococcaceae bacterium OttesenSCG-928-O06]|nr:helix-turn-helix domain-containing protein [Ruminococcaceae bacterium OttesenSCG-928-O06]
MGSDNNSTTAIGARIKRLRTSAGETQAQLASAINVKRETVNQWENGQRDLKVQYIVDITSHYGISCDELIMGIKPENLDLHRKTGLSENAMRTCAGVQDMWNRDYQKRESYKIEKTPEYIDILNDILSTTVPQKQVVPEALKNIIKIKKSHVIEHIIVNLWEAIAFRIKGNACGEDLPDEVIDALLEQGRIVLPYGAASKTMLDAALNKTRVLYDAIVDHYAPEGGTPNG